MEVRILGPLEVWAAGRPLPLGGTKQRAVLAMLVLQANQVVSIDYLVDGLWGQAPPDSATNAVQVYISRLRKLMHADPAERPAAFVVVRRKPGYLLELDADELDLARYEWLTHQGTQALRAAPGLAAAKLREALGLWRGPPLAEFTDEPFAQAERARLQEQRLTVVQARIEADLALGRHAELVGELEALVARYPLREELHQQLLLSLYRSGRQAEALEAYRRVRQTLTEELGIDPGHALQELQAAILVQDRRLDWTPPPSHGRRADPDGPRRGDTGAHGPGRHRGRSRPRPVSCRRCGRRRCAIRISLAAAACLTSCASGCAPARARWWCRRCTAWAAWARPSWPSSTPTGSPATTTWSGGSTLSRRCSSPASSPGWAASSTCRPG